MYDDSEAVGFVVGIGLILVLFFMLVVVFAISDHQEEGVINQEEVAYVF